MSYIKGSAEAMEASADDVRAGRRSGGCFLGVDAYLDVGANHPVRDIKTGRVIVTVQNHGYAVIADDDISHVSLNDGTVEGLIGDGFASVQFHPEASPGPLDALPFFDRLADACRSAPIFTRS